MSSSNYTRRVPPPGQQYHVVPQSPRAAGPSRQPSVQNQSFSSMGLQGDVSQMSYMSSRQGRDETTHRVATGQIGGGYGPYSVRDDAFVSFDNLLMARAPL